MKTDQKQIYFLGGEDRKIVAESPLIEKLVADGYEVILGDDPLDETVFSSFKQYKEFRIVNVARNDFKDPSKNDNTRKEVKALTKTFQPLIDYASQQLKDLIKDVKVSLRLVNNPAVIVADMMNDTPNKERIELGSAMRTNLFRHSEKNTLEINPYHPLIQELNKRVEESPDETTHKLVKSLYNAALVHTGFVLKNPMEFSGSIFELINTSLGLKEQVE